uniref:Thioesterase domain-containing protein n=1 Tax=Aegilops tauschii TaxID=37682 RepID=N1QZA2_AEGTA
MSVEGIIKVSVHYDISYFAPAKHHLRERSSGVAGLRTGSNFRSAYAISDAFHFIAQFQVEEVEMDGRVVDRKGRMTAVTTEVRKKESGELVAIGRQWMTTSRPKGYQGSKL